MITLEQVIYFAPRIAIAVVCIVAIVLLWIYYIGEQRDKGIVSKLRVYVCTAALAVLGTSSALGGVSGVQSLIIYLIAAPDTPADTPNVGQQEGDREVIVDPPPPPPSSEVANCTQYTLVDAATGRLNAGDLNSCVSEITDCDVFTANFCHRYPGGTPTAGGYSTCISYIWKHMTSDDRAAFRTAIAAQPLCKDIFHSILN